jgi:ubiquitin-activating enzyme E1
MNIESVKQEFDANLYSRQVGTFGVETMNKFVKLRVLVLGLGGVGIEVAKNLILAGPKSVTLYDSTKLTNRDLESNYYADATKVAAGLTRVQATLSHLAELNNYVAVDALEPATLEDLFSYEQLQRYDVVVVTEWFNINLIKRLNDACNALNKGFIFAAAAGLAGAIFVDFGTKHIVTDKDGEECFVSLVANITEEGIVTTQENQRHNLLEGDLITFTEVVGMDKLNNAHFKVQKVISPYSFSIGDLRPLQVGSYVRNGIIQQLKDPKNLVFNSLTQSLDNFSDNLIDCDLDWELEHRPSYLKMLIIAYWQFVSEFGIPDFYAPDALAKFEAFLSSKIIAAKKQEEWKKAFETHIHKLFFGLAAGTFSSIQSFFGAITAQEIVKFTGKYTPIHQWFVHEWYWSGFKKLSYEDFAKHRADVEAHRNSRYLSHIALLGKALHDKALKSNVYMVGAGALGCEYLKYFAMSGLCCGDGQVVLTDDDTIEISNLNRQFLFRHKHVGSSKSEVAGAVAAQMNPALNVIAKKARASPDTESIFTDQFWDALDFVVNAVDNIKARQYVDQKCVFHVKPLFEAGTLGTKCNSQLILPGLTEAYSDSKDPKEKDVPMCTMRSFPYLIDHCIEWARAKFFDLFVQVSKFLKEFFSDPIKGTEKFKKEVKTNISATKELCENLVHFLPLLENPRPEAYVKFARDFYQYAFYDQIKQLITSFPEDAKDKDGNLFWTSPKRPPMVVPFDLNNPDHLAFIATICNILQQFIVPINKFHFTPSEIQAVLRTLPVRQMEIDSSEEARAKLIAEAANPNTDSTKDVDTLNNICAALLELSRNPAQVHFEEIEFEKDNDENGHIDFITFTANSRASNYKITNLPRYKVKIIAGKIIPAIATTTAMVSATVMVEIFKHLLQVPLECTRNFFSNLAIPIFMFSEPSPPVVRQDKEYDEIVLGPVKVIPPKSNTWSRLDIKGPKTLNQIKDEVFQAHGFTLSSFMIAGDQIYSTYSPNQSYRLTMTVEQILNEAKFATYPGKRYVLISVGGETDDMVDVDCPYIKYQLGN